MEIVTSATAASYSIAAASSATILRRKCYADLGTSYATSSSRCSLIVAIKA